jgi:membrane associated rhomboid family serine protease
MSFRSRTRTAGIFYVPGFPRGVKWLLIANVAIFILDYFSRFADLHGPIVLFFGLTPVDVVKRFEIWQLATYMFLHGGFGHILWNMLALWMFGAELEGVWGMRRFLQFYFFCGIGAGVCVVIANYLLPWGNPNIPTIGCSGAIFGILMAYAILYPTRTILFGFLIPIQVKYFVMIIGAIAFLSSFQVNSGVSEFAHLGGLLFGYLFLKSPKNVQFDLTAPVRRGYTDWKLRRAKKKFQVYLRKQGSDRGPTIH